MTGFIVRLMITASGLATAAWLLDGVHISGFFTLVFSAMLLGIINATLRPVAFLLTLPITIVTLGMFVLLLNAAMLGLVAWLMPGFSIHSLFSGIATWMIVSAMSWLGSLYIGPDARYELLVRKRA